MALCISGLWARLASGVRVEPGATQLTRIPSPASSIASCVVNATTPPFDAEYAARSTLPRRPETEAIVTTDPPPSAASRSTNSLTTANVETRFSSRVRLNRSGVVCRIGALSAVPAEVTTVSTRPNSSSATSRSRRMSPSSVTSTRTPTVRVSGSGAVSPDVCDRSAEMTCQPKSRIVCTLPGRSRMRHQ